ncbi:MAG: hypothetical protein ACHQ1D_03645, partial [Nitrososphaerales archaeon]
MSQQRQFSFGYLPDVPAIEDYTIHDVKKELPKGLISDLNKVDDPAVPNSEVLPTLVDNRKYCSAIQEQGSLGSCFTGDTLITMGNLSEKMIKDIEIGEKVSNKYGQQKRVTRKYERNYTGELYKIRFRGYDTTIACTEEHPFFIKHFTRHWNGLVSEKESWMLAKNIDLSDRPRITIPKLIRENPSCNTISIRKFIEEECHYDPETNKVWTIGSKQKYALPENFELTSDFARFLGLFLAEGSYRKDNCGEIQGINLTFNRKNDSQYIDFIDKLFKTMFDINIEIKKTEKRPSIIDVTISNKTLSSLIKKLCGEYSFGKELSPILFDQPKEVKISLLRGWLEGDGWTKKALYKSSRSENKIRLQKSGVTISEKLCRGLMRLALSCDIKSTFVKKINNKYGKSMSYTLNFYGEGVFKIFPEYRELESMIDHKNMNKYKEDDKNFYCEITSIEKTYVENIPVYNLEVEDDHEYIANLCLVHNCTSQASVSMMEYMQKKVYGSYQDGSRLFVYWQTRKYMGDQYLTVDSGAYNRLTMKTIAKYGIPEEVNWKYNIADFAKKPPQEVFDDAESNVALKYFRLDGDSVYGEAYTNRIKTFLY